MALGGGDLILCVTTCRELLSLILVFWFTFCELFWFTLFVFTVDEDVEKLLLVLFDTTLLSDVCDTTELFVLFVVVELTIFWS